MKGEVSAARKRMKDKDLAGCRRRETRGGKKKPEDGAKIEKVVGRKESIRRQG